MNKSSYQHGREAAREWLSQFTSGDKNELRDVANENDGIGHVWIDWLESEYLPGTEYRHLPENPHDELTNANDRDWWQTGFWDEVEEALNT